VGAGGPADPCAGANDRRLEQLVDGAIAAIALGPSYRCRWRVELRRLVGYVRDTELVMTDSINSAIAAGAALALSGLTAFVTSQAAKRHAR
jgi:hypothetical protein